MEKVNIAVVTTGLECRAADYTLEHAQSAHFSRGQFLRSQIFGRYEEKSLADMGEWRFLRHQCQTGHPWTRKVRVGLKAVELLTLGL